jgi:hypothetical protein
MKLEDQAVPDAEVRKERRSRVIDQPMQRPARLLDEK